jgi:hypothetical protein
VQLQLQWLPDLSPAFPFAIRLCAQVVQEELDRVHMADLLY